MKYETIFIVNPELDESDINAVTGGVKTAIESGGGKVEKLEPWGKKKLAYPIRKHTDGYYVLTVFEGTPELTKQLNNHYLITESIIKHMIVQFEASSSTRRTAQAEGSERDNATGSSGAGAPKDIESDDETDDDDES